MGLSPPDPAQQWEPPAKQDTKQGIIAVVSWVLDGYFTRFSKLNALLRRLLWILCR